MRVLLAHRCHDEGLDDEAAVALPPGLPWLASSLKAVGHDATIANLSRLSWKDVERYLAEHAPEVVGLTCFTANRKSVSRLVACAGPLIEPRSISTDGRVRECEISGAYQSRMVQFAN